MNAYPVIAPRISKDAYNTERAQTLDTVESTTTVYGGGKPYLVFKNVASGWWETRTPTMREKARLLCFPPVCILELELMTAKRSVENSQPYGGWPYAA